MQFTFSQFLQDLGSENVTIIYNVCAVSALCL